jgi:hypothetical protein
MTVPTISKTRAKMEEATRPTSAPPAPRWSPHGPTLLAATAAATTPAPHDYTPYLAEIQRLQCALAAHTGTYQPGADFGMTVALQATPMPADRPREFYCWLHGWNNTHHGITCKIMGANTAYTHAMKNATGPTNTGGNPKVSVPVHLHRPHFTFLCPRPPCVPCMPSSPPFPPQTPPTPSRRRQALNNAFCPTKPLEQDPQFLRLSCSSRLRTPSRAPRKTLALDPQQVRFL